MSTESKFLHNLGDKVRDRVTGFTGIVVAQTRWLNGCKRLNVQPQELKDGKPIDIHSFDEEQVELIQAGAFTAPPPEKTPGGPFPTATRP